MTLLLRRSEVDGLLDLKQAMRVLKQTFREQSAGKVKQVPPLRFMDRGMRMVVGGLEAQNKNGLRMSVTGGESIALLFEISSGELLAMMGYPFSNLRIRATVGLATDRLSTPKAESVALIGSGRLAMPILEPALAVRSIKRVLVYRRNPDNREAFARKAMAKLKLPVASVASPQAAIDEAEIVLVSTNSPVAALLGQWLRPGLSVFGIGRPNEFDAGNMGVRGSTEKGTRSGDQYRIKETIMRLTYPWLAAIFIYMGTCTSVGAAMAAQAGWEEVVKAAEKEGEVTVYATNSVGDLTVIWDAFKKKFP